jgi:hypothetical protein
MLDIYGDIDVLLKLNFFHDSSALQNLPPEVVNYVMAE